MDVAGVHLADASGLSVDNRIPARLLDQALTAPRATPPQLRPMLDYLPVAGATGTLSDRYASGDRAAPDGSAPRPELSTTRARCRLRGGHRQRVLTFALMSNGRPPEVSRPALDAIAATLRSCGCR